MNMQDDYFALLNSILFFAGLVSLSLAFYCGRRFFMAADGLRLATAEFAVRKCQMTDPNDGPFLLTFINQSFQLATAHLRIGTSSGSIERQADRAAARVPRLAPSILTKFQPEKMLLLMAVRMAAAAVTA